MLPDLPQLLDHLPISSVTTVGTSSLLSHGQVSSESVPPGLYSSTLVARATSASTQCTLTAIGSFQRPISSSRSLRVPLAQERPAPLADDSIPSLIAVHSSLPLLSKRIVQQIQAGEFVDLADLPPARSRQSSSIPPMSALSPMGVLQLQEIERRQKLLPDFLTWSQCFAVYTAVLGSCQPQRISELMSYQYEIAKCARKFKWPSWVIYDINFRQEAASYPTLSWAEAASYPTLSWAEAAGHREPKIYQQCFNGMEKDPLEGWCRSCLSLDHTTSLCPSAPTTPQQPPFLLQRKCPMGDPTLALPESAREICRNFNTKGCKYPKCRRRHVCVQCYGGHPQHRCPLRPIHQGVPPVQLSGPPPQ